MCETIKIEDFFGRVEAWRKRYAVNDLAVYPSMGQLEWFEDRKVTYNNDDTVTLQCYFQKDCESSKWER
jgi:hypothetical protein